MKLKHNRTEPVPVVCNESLIFNRPLPGTPILLITLPSDQCKSRCLWQHFTPVLECDKCSCCFW
jgi:hypothetical protein